MGEGRFWTLVAESQGDAYRLKRLLVRLSREDILAFDMLLDDALYHLDRRDIHEITDGSDDGFLYVRLWIVSRGREYYESVLCDPEKAPHDADFAQENEEFMYVAMEAYQEKLGEPWPVRPHRWHTGANETGWV